MKKRKYDMSGVLEIIDPKLYDTLVEYMRNNKLNMAKASKLMGMCRFSFTKIFKDKAITSLTTYYKIRDFFKGKE